MSQPNAIDNAALENVEAVTAEPTTDATPNYSKQSLNIYTVMLVVAFVCLIAAIIVLSAELARWDGLPFPYKTIDAEPVFNLISLPKFFG